MLKKIDIEAEYLLFILSLIVVVGLIGYYSYTKTDAYQTAHSQKTETVNGTAVSSKSDLNKNSYTFTGSKTQVISLKEGLNEFNIEYTGNSNFNAAVLYLDGVLLDSLATSKGQYKGITGVVAPESRNYILSVQCGDNGQWTLTRR